MGHVNVAIDRANPALVRSAGCLTPCVEDCAREGLLPRTGPQLVTWEFRAMAHGVASLLRYTRVTAAPIP